MSGRVQQSMFFLGLPDLKKLCCVTLSLQGDDEELRTKQIKTCRELVLLYFDILASPALDSFTAITVVMAIPFFRKGILQAFVQRRSLQLGSPQCVFPGVLQCCLSYSLITRLAPSWNKAGLYLIPGKDFLTEGGRLSAVSMELSTSEGQLCISIEANTVRLPQTTLEDFDIPPLVLRRFCSDPDFVLEPGGAIWCHVLPSMKRGQIISISRKLPRDGPFRTYRDMQNHWNCLYGYRLPDLPEEEVVYCSVYFRPVGQRLFTYPLICVRLQLVQRCPGVDLQGALVSFLSDVRSRLQSVCGFPALLTSKPCYHTVSLNAAATAQVLSGEQAVLTASSSTRPVLSQLPTPPPRPVRPLFGSPLSQQDSAKGLLGNEHGFRGGLTQTQECRGDRSWPSSSSSPAILPPPRTPVIPAPKLVPIFKNKCPSRHVNVALLRVQEQKEELSRRGDETRRLLLPAFRKKIPTSASSPSVSSSSLPVPPQPTIPCFNRQPHSSATSHPTGHPKLKHIPRLSPASEPKPGLILTPKIQIKFKSSPETDMKAGSESVTAANLVPRSPHPQAPPCDISNRDASTSSRRGMKKSRSASCGENGQKQTVVQAELCDSVGLVERKRSGHQCQTQEGRADAEGHGLSGRGQKPANIHTHTHTLHIYSIDSLWRINCAPR